MLLRSAPLLLMLSGAKSARHDGHDKGGHAATVWAVPTSAVVGIVGVSYVSNCLSWVRNLAAC